MVWPPQMRAELEAKYGEPWPFPDDLCGECWTKWVRSPEGKKQLDPLLRSMDERWRRDLERWKQNARSAALRVLDVADTILEKFR